MPHVIEPAPTGRATCRVCGVKIPKAELRFGERVPNPFGDEGDETTHWYHVRCGAFARPEAFLQALEGAPDLPDRSTLETEARLGVAHPRLTRVTKAERATTGRATCRSCREPIARGSWRLVLRYYEEGRFVPSGFIHVACALPYLGTTAILPRVRHFTPALSDDDVLGSGLFSTVVDK